MTGGNCSGGYPLGLIEVGSVGEVFTGLPLVVIPNQDIITIEVLVVEAVAGNRDVSIAIRRLTSRLCCWPLVTATTTIIFLVISIGTAKAG